MEFFRHTKLDASETQLQNRLVIERLPEFCQSIDRIISLQGDSGEIYCLWGQFAVNREEIRGGVRFTLPSCPNALTWTITGSGSSPDNFHVVVHCTINRQDHDADFVESIEQFVDAWVQGLDAAFRT